MPSPLPRRNPLLERAFESGRTRRTRTLIRLALVLTGVAAIAGVITLVGLPGSGRTRDVEQTPQALTTEPVTPPTLENETTVPAVPPTSAPGAATQAPVVRRVATTAKQIFITIDDGLVRDPRVVRFFRRTHYPATLFLVRGPAQSGQSYFRSLQKLGATIEAHTTDHTDLRKLGSAALQKDVCGDVADLARWYGRAPTLFRPPYGVYDSRIINAAASCGLRPIVLWSGSMNDGRLDLVGGKLIPGSIILMHFRTDLYQNLRVLESRLKKAGFKVGRLEDHVGSGP